MLSAIVRRCAEAVQVGEAVVVGVLQHSGIVPFKNLNRFKEPVLASIPESMKRLGVVEAKHVL